MGNISTNAMILLCFVAVLCSCLSCVNGGPPLPWDKFTLHVSNGISDSSNLLYVHCRSKDDDMGVQYLSFNQERHWKFGTTIFGKLTHFTCDFKWGEKSRSFEAFVDGVESNFCQSTLNVYWRAAMDGIYFGCSDNPGIKRCVWDQNIECSGP
ncbi:hypothetical protein RND81_06G087400 [Saponaria officinalis]|uniref:S-protein homolog n=1 Tax=Saponaria officinalis TaxID=3572 RepID=A0AAW1K9F7_SAPOF